MFDCILINDELDILDIRLNTLDSVIEKFVIVESDLTHSGKPKPLHFQENWSRFEKFKDKIIHLVYHAHAVDPNNPNLIASHERLVQQLFEWQKRINSTQMRLNMELQMVQAENPKQEEMFKNGVKKFYDMMA
jgi:hypothetical protein